MTTAPAAQPPVASRPIVRHDADTGWIMVYAWERHGTFHNLLAGGDEVAPYDAALMYAKVYTFPTGEIRVIRFTRGVRTHPHENMTDTLIYTVSGRRVQFVNDRALETTPGDASFHPRGVMHHSETLEEGIGMEFAYPAADPLPDPQATWTAGAGLPLAAAGPGQQRRFDYGRYAIDELRLAAGAALPRDANPRGRLLFLLSGRIEIAIDDAVLTVAPHDAVDLPAGAGFVITAASDSIWIESPTPRG